LCVSILDLQNIFLFKPFIAFVILCIVFFPTVDIKFYSSWDGCPSNLWTLPAFSELSTITRDDLTCPELRLQLLRLNFAHTMSRNLTSGSASSRPSLQWQGSDHRNSNTNALANLPNQVLRDILDTLDVCNDSDDPF
jgi:hypothetical protein